MPLHAQAGWGTGTKKQRELTRVFYVESSTKATGTWAISGDLDDSVNRLSSVTDMTCARELARLELSERARSETRQAERAWSSRFQAKRFLAAGSIDYFLWRFSSKLRALVDR